MKDYSVQEVATLMQVMPNTVNNWIRQGKLEATGAKPKEWSISQDALINFVREHPSKAKLMDILDRLMSQRKATADELYRIDKCIMEVQQLYKQRTKNSKISYEFD